jgi:AsmA protein
MKHKWKIVAAVVGAIILLVAAIPLFVNINTFKPIIEHQLTAALGRQVKLGELSLSVPSGTVEARNFEVADDPEFSSEPFITATAIRMGVQMRLLVFHRQILIESLEIEAPQIHLVHAANGAWNFSTLGRNAANQTQALKQPSIPDFTVDNLRIRNGHAKMENLPAAGPPLVIDKIDLTVQNFAAAKQFPFTLSAVLPREATLTMTGKAGPINPHDVAKTTFDAQLALHNFDPVAAGLMDKSAGISVLADIDAHTVSDGS